MTEDYYTTLRRKATSAVSDMICSTSPAQAAFRDVGRHQDMLMRQRFELRTAGADTEAVTDQILAYGERLLELADLIEIQWGRFFDLRQGPMDDEA